MTDPLLGLRFDTIAERYHRVRPHYPDALWDALVAETGIMSGSHVLELGAGTGIATAELVRRGCHVTALEPGAAMAAIIARDLGASGQVEVVVDRFETWQHDGEPFDLVLGATSLQWVDRRVLRERLARLVRPGGHAALMHYLHVVGGDMAFFDAAQPCYVAHDPEYRPHRIPPPEAHGKRTTMLNGLPGFTPAFAGHWLVDERIDRERYLEKLATYSTTLRLPDANRAALLSCIGDLMDRDHGGEVTMIYRHDLVLMRRR